jgi:protein-L-isoaspartate(D-aspartate) O-methyltransferase
MITQQVRAWDVLDDRVLDAMRTVRREHFVPERFRDLAFADAEIALGHGEHMLAPKLVGRILQALDVGQNSSVLEVGTGSAYMSACLARLGASVRSFELHPDIADHARANLARELVAAVSISQADAFATELGDGYSHAVLTGSLPQYDARFERTLAVGGRLFVIVGEAPLMEARLITRIGPTDWRTENLFETAVAPLHRAPTAAAFEF